jgi:glycerophosphoryl diester phosphodiesterase
MLRIPLFVLCLLLAACAGPAERQEAPRAAPTHVLPAHSHNDHTRARPLLDALDLRLASVEADVFLVEAELLVAHDRDRCRPERTLDALYLQPLIDRARQNHGRIYADTASGQPLLLFIDIKENGADAYAAIDRRLRAARDVFTSFDTGVVTPRAVTVIISGDIPRELIAQQYTRYAFVDGRAPDLEDGSPAPASLVPVVSMPWTSQFRWHGLGEMPTDERARLERLVHAAHARGYLLRFWGVPPLEHVWRAECDAGVDLLNVDDIGAAAAFLRARRDAR